MWSAHTKTHLQISSTVSGATEKSLVEPGPYTVKHLYFGGQIFHGFRELTCMCEIIFIEIWCLCCVLLYKYFQKAPSALPNQNGPLSDCMPSEPISSSNHDVSGLILQDRTIQSSRTKTIQGLYTNFSTDDKVWIAKRAAEFSIRNTLRYFQK